VTRSNPRAGQGGRPRTFQDSDFFQATTTVLAASGYGGLTLEAVARELGCTGAAVSRRFGSKRGLVRAYLEWAIEATTRRFQEVRAAHASPVDALRARSIIPADQRPEEIGDPADPDHQANMATFWAQMHSDPEFRPVMVRHVRAADAATADLLRAAIAAGELTNCDPDEVGRVLTAAWSFTTHSWPGDGPDGTLEERLGRIFDTVIGPHRTAN
jgi:AcrR family transcriptional regulator